MANWVDNSRGNASGKCGFFGVNFEEKSERESAQIFSLSPFSGTLAFVVSLLLWPSSLRARSFFHVI